MSIATMAALFLHGLRNLGDTEFWLDESGQFWMAMGQSHFYPAGTPKLPISIENIMASNLDPPGFTVLLRIWIDLFGTTPFALRLLPFIFFVGTIVTLGIIAQRHFGIPTSMGYLGGFAALAISDSRQYSTELRAYSFELFAVVTMAAILFEWISRNRPRDLWLLSFASVLFLWSTRYSIVFSVFAIWLTVVIIIVLRGERRSLRDASAPAILVVLATLSLLSYMYVASKLIGSTPDYVMPLLLSEQEDWSGVARILLANLILPPGVFITIFLAFTTYWFVHYFLEQLAKRFPKAASYRAFDISDGIKVQMLALGIYAGVTSVVSVAASAVGIYPWHIEHRWSIGLVGISMISAVALVALTWLNLAQKRDPKETIYERPAKRVKPNPLPVVGRLLLLSTFIVSAIQVARYEHVVYEQIGTKDEPGFSHVALLYEDYSLNGLTVWHVQSGLWPSFRMATEAWGNDTANSSNAFILDSVPNGAQEIEAFLTENVACSVGVRSVFLLFGNESLKHPLHEHLLQLEHKSSCTGTQDLTLPGAILLTLNY